MKNCPICNNQVKKNTKICPYCQNDIIDYQGIAKKATIYGIVSIVGFFIPLIGIWCGISAISWGCQSIKNKEYKDKSIIAIVLGIIGMIITIVFASIFIW